MIRRYFSIAVIGLAALSMALLNGERDAQAAGLCGPSADACVIVNSSGDVDTRDSVVTLREALRLQSGSLSVDALTVSEALQVRQVTTLGLRGSVEVNFDLAVFCEQCSDAAILLQPPGLGDPDGYLGDKVLALPPGLGDPDGAPPGLGHRSLIGMGVSDGQLVAANVVIDGANLGPEYVGMWLTGMGSLQGITFRNFAGHAIEIDGKLAHKIRIGSDGDGVNDSAEAVLFENNGADVVILPAK